MDSDKLMRGIIPGIIAGYLFLAFVGASVVPGDLSVTTDDAGMVTAVEQSAPAMMRLWHGRHGRRDDWL